MRLACSPSNVDELAISTASGVLLVDTAEAATTGQPPLENRNSLPDGMRLLETGAAVTALAYSLDKRWLAAGTADGKVTPHFALVLNHLHISMTELSGAPDWNPEALGHRLQIAWLTQEGCTSSSALATNT